MKNLSAIIFSFFLLIFLGTCTKPQSSLQLPPATHVGANILACKVNGQVFISSGASDKILGIGVSYEVYGDSFTFISANASNPGFEILMGSKYNFALGTYKLETTPFGPGALYDTFTSDSTHGGYITYAFYDGNILAGSFAFDVPFGNDSVLHITEGRFDIQNH